MRTTCTAACSAALLTLALPAFGQSSEWVQAPFPETLSSPKVYLFPMGFEGTGQLGTDISKQLIDIVLEDVKKQKPDIIVLKLNSAEFNKIRHLKDENPNEYGFGAFEEFRDIMTTFQDGTRDIPQVMWVEDSVGYGTLMALGWPRLYMTSEARLSGMTRVRDRAAGWDDPDVAAKMLAAATGLGKGLPARGGYSEALANAMIFPERFLSVNFDGRSVAWLTDSSGSWVVDGSKDSAANFTAALAEDVLLSDGTADTLDDLMFLLGYREFTKIETGEKLSKQWVDDWRKALDRCLTWMKEAAETEDTPAGLGKRKTIYEKVLAALKQYKCLEFRRELGSSGITKDNLENGIDDLKKEIQRLREAEKDSRREGGGSSGGGGRGLGGGGMGRPKGG